MITNYAYLYVEDDPLSREALGLTMRRVLQVEQFAMLEDSQDFIERVGALEFQPDVFMLDIHMQPDDGFEMLRQLRAHPAYKDACIIALTASVMNEEIEVLRGAGFDGIIGKPIDIETFPDLLGRILDGNPPWYIGS